jgi:hypothetical protein
MRWSSVVGDMVNVLLLLELHGRVELRVKAMHRLRSVPTTAAPSGVVFHLVGVVVEFRS